MLRLRDIMTRDIVTMSPELTVREAMDLLATKHVSGAPVVSGGKVVGVISATDLLALASSLPGVPEVRADQTEWGQWTSATEEMEDEGGDEPTATYFTEMWDDAGADVSERLARIASPEWNVLEEHTVDEAMTEDIRSLAPDIAVPVAAAFLDRAGIHRVLIMESGRLVGIVSATDIAKAVAARGLTNRAYAFNRNDEFDERGWFPGAGPRET